MIPVVFCGPYSWQDLMGIQSKVDYRFYFIAAAVAAGLLPSASISFAATSTATFSVQVTIVATCTINSASALNFGSQGVFTANVDQFSTIQVQCTNTTPYTIGLDAGLGSATVGTNTVAATGNGAAQSY